MSTECDGSSTCDSPLHIEGCFATNPDYNRDRPTTAREVLDGIRGRLAHPGLVSITRSQADVVRLTAAVEAVLLLTDEWQEIAVGATQFDSALRVCSTKTRAAIEAALKEDPQ